MNNLYEKSGIFSRLKESARLVVFIFLALIFSIVVMNLLVLPVALFSINNKTVFTDVVQVLFLIIVFLSVLYLTGKKIILLRKYEIDNLKILKHLFLSPFSTIMFILIVLFIIAVIIAAIYYILQNNYYILYKLINL